MKLKIREVLEMKKAFEALDLIPMSEKDLVPGFQMSYACAKTENKIQPILKAVEKISKLSPDYLKFEEERLKLNIEYCEKDENLKPVILNGSQFKIADEHAKKFQTEFKKLEKKYDKAIKERLGQQKKIDEFLETEEMVELHKFPSSALPPKIHKLVVKALLPMIED